MKITIAQALLLLIDFYQRQKNIETEPTKKQGLESDYKALLYFYINGPQNPNEKTKLYKYLDAFKSTVLNNFTYPSLNQNTAEMAKSIDSDPTKRYFETHLAWESIKRGIDPIDISKLNKYKEALIELYKKDKQSYDLYMKILDGEIPQTSDLEKLVSFKEYADFISRIKNETLFREDQGFSEEQREKILNIVQCTALAVLCARSTEVKQVLPLNLYEKEPFTGKYRGNTPKGTQDNPVDKLATSSHHHGLMKSFMPLSREDEAMSTEPYGYEKPSEKVGFNVSAPWPKLNFSRLVHPFSNSISGTALCQLKVLAKFHHDPYLFNSSFTGDEKTFKDFYRAFSSLLLFFSGGHTYLEFLYPLQLFEVVSEFSSPDPLIGDYLKLSRTTIFNLFQPDSNAPSDINIKEGVEAAINKTISYNQLYLNKKAVHEELTAFDQSKLKRVDTIESHDLDLIIVEDDTPNQQSKKRKREDDSDSESTKAPRTEEKCNPHSTLTNEIDIANEENTDAIESKKRKREDENSPSEKRSKFNEDFTFIRKPSASESTSSAEEKKPSDDKKKNRPF